MALLSTKTTNLLTKNATHFFRSPVTTATTSAPAATRHVSSSPYGRTHVWKRRPKKLPNPCVPTYPQLVVRADGATYTQYTTSPRSVIRLTRDVSNHPLWNAPSIASATRLARSTGAADADGDLDVGMTGGGASASEEDEEVGSAGRLGRFSRKFGGMGGKSQDRVEWMEGVDSGEGLTSEQLQEMRRNAWEGTKVPKGTEPKGKKGGPGSGRRK